MAYATPADLTRLAIPEAAISRFSSAEREAALQAASDEADGYLRGRFRLPLVKWADDLRRYVCQIAAWSLIASRGIDPNGISAEVLKANRDDALRWLRDVADGRTTPSVTGSAPAGFQSSPRVYSRKPRGWY